MVLSLNGSEEKGPSQSLFFDYQMFLEALHKLMLFFPSFSISTTSLNMYSLWKLFRIWAGWAKAP